jgi:hypothetical protein
MGEFLQETLLIQPSESMHISLTFPKKIGPDLIAMALKRLGYKLNR